MHWDRVATLYFPPAKVATEEGIEDIVEALLAIQTDLRLSPAVAGFPPHETIRRGSIDLPVGPDQLWEAVERAVPDWVERNLFLPRDSR